jgi:peptidoglycan-associated lipoprotein
MKKKLAVFLMVCLLVPGLALMTSCGKRTVKKSADTAGHETSAVDSSAAAATDGMSAEEKWANAEDSPEAARAKFISENIYFDFDSAELKVSATDVLNRKAKWLTDNPDENVIIEGHCDERGTTAYNMALGELRAKSAQAYLKKTGITGDRMSTVSYGEEQPVDPGHNETAWSQNRRAHFEIK